MEAKGSEIEDSQYKTIFCEEFTTPNEQTRQCRKGDRLDSEQMRQHNEQERLESKQERLDREQVPYSEQKRLYSELGELGSCIASWRGRKENRRFVQREGKGWLASSYVYAVKS
jgi:hypothetical protein